MSCPSKIQDGCNMATNICQNEKKNLKNTLFNLYYNSVYVAMFLGFYVISNIFKINGISNRPFSLRVVPKYFFL